MGVVKKKKKNTSNIYFLGVWVNRREKKEKGQGGEGFSLKEKKDKTELIWLLCILRIKCHVGGGGKGEGGKKRGVGQSPGEFASIAPT